jgi:hypothetical protein
MDNTQDTDSNRASGLDHGGLAEQAAGKAREAKNAAVDFARKTVEGMDAQRRPAAATLDHAASTLQQHADNAAGVAHATSDRLRATAQYVRNNDMNDMGRHIGDLVRRYPGQALAAAAVAGFLVARAMRTRA